MMECAGFGHKRSSIQAERSSVFHAEANEYISGFHRCALGYFVANKLEKLEKAKWPIDMERWCNRDSSQQY